jgi:hypothetical protein
MTQPWRCDDGKGALFSEGSREIAALFYLFSNLAFSAWYSDSLMAPEFLAFWRSINCWPIVGSTVTLLWPPPTDQEQPLATPASEAISNRTMIDFFDFFIGDYGFYGFRAAQIISLAKPVVQSNFRIHSCNRDPTSRVRAAMQNAVTGAVTSAIHWRNNAAFPPFQPSTMVLLLLN